MPYREKGASARLRIVRKIDNGTKNQKVDYSELTKGMRLQAEGGDGVYYAAEVLEVSTSKKRAKAPVKVHFAGYPDYDEWLAADRLRSKALKPKGQAEKPQKDGKTRAPPSTRFTDPWFKKYAVPTSGYVDESGFTQRLPLRLESSEVMVYGTCDAEKMMADFPGEPFKPVLVGGKAVVSIWFNKFKDTDCGGKYLETWYNTFVTDRGEAQLELPYEKPMDLIITDPKSHGYLQRVFCADFEDNPGAARKAIEGGRAIWGFPKHPEPGKIRFDYTQEGKNVEYDGSHGGKTAVTLRIRLPEADEGAITIPVEAKLGRDAQIAGPHLGGTHLGMNGTHQTRHGSAMKFTQHVKPWDEKTDSLSFGDDSHYAAPISRWGFVPLLKAHSPDFKIVAFKPSGWISGRKAAADCKEHEARLAKGEKAGQL